LTVRLRLIVSVIGVLLSSVPICATYAEDSDPTKIYPRRDTIKPFCLHPIGVVKKQGTRARLEIYPEFAPALKGLKDFSHLWVFYWFHENDTPEQRRTLQVHPRRNPANPLTGVFACRSLERPNLIGFTVCRIIKVK